MPIWNSEDESQGEASRDAGVGRSWRRKPGTRGWPDALNVPMFRVPTVRQRRTLSRLVFCSLRRWFVICLSCPSGRNFLSLQCRPRYPRPTVAPRQQKRANSSHDEEKYRSQDVTAVFAHNMAAVDFSMVSILLAAPWARRRETSSNFSSKTLTAGHGTPVSGARMSW